MLNQKQFETLQQKRATATGADFWLYDALICLELDIPDLALKSLERALNSIKES